MNLTPVTNGLSTTEKWLVLAISIMGVIAHLYNLDIIPLTADEPIRAVVALEMMLSENYVVPTNFGEFYYKKPPLYNWIIIAFWELFQSTSLFIFRLPSVLPLFAFVWVIWKVVRPHLGSKVGVIAGLAFVLSGRLLTRDSMLGHIDILFSLITFIQFYVVFHFWKKKNYWGMYLLAYFLASLGVLMKGLPSFLFLGFTIGLWLIINKDWKRLFHPAHFVALGLMGLLVGGYFYTYSHYNSLEDYFFYLYDQSSQRTVIANAWYDSLLNIFAFPFENIGHLFPTSQLFLFLLKKDIWRKIWQNDFLKFTLVTLCINIIPYWLSPGYYPRYLFMLYPLAFILASYGYVNMTSKKSRIKWVFDYFILLIGVLLILAAIVFPWYTSVVHTFSVETLVGGSIVLLFAGSILTWYKLRAYRVYTLFLFLVLGRLAFDFYVLPYRIEAEGGEETERFIVAQDLIKLTKGEDVAVLFHSPVHTDFAYYLGIDKNDILSYSSEPQPKHYYLVSEQNTKDLQCEKIYSYHERWKNTKIWLIRMK